MTAALAVDELRSGYGDLIVVHELSLSVDAGEVVCLLGANGAGKSTTLFTIAGVLKPMAGRVTLFGEPMPAGDAAAIARRGLTLVPQDRGLFYGLTVAENLRLRRPRRPTVDQDEVLDILPALRPLMDRRTGLLSGGEQQMLALAGGLVGEPKVLLVDEMSLGLAPIIVERLLPVVRRVADERGMAVLIVEQYVRAALAVSDRGYVMQRGRLVASGTASELSDAAKQMEESYLGPSTR